MLSVVVGSTCSSDGFDPPFGGTPALSELMASVRSFTFILKTD